MEPNATSGYAFNAYGDTTFGMTLQIDSRTVYLSRTECESLAETAAILADKSTMRLLRQGEQDAARGRLIPWDQVKKDLGL